MLCATHVLATALKKLVKGMDPDIVGFEQLFLEARISEEKLKLLIADRFASTMEETLQSSVIVTQQKSFASELRTEILHSTTSLLREKIP
jgi:hypothetical protein